MKDRPNYYAVLPSEVRYDKELKDKAKLLYAEICALTDKDGRCWATNQYFADLYGISKTTVSLLIKNLVEKGYVKSVIEYKEGTQEILNRYLTILKGGYLRKIKYPIKEKLKENNTSIINTSIINKERNIKERKSSFLPPTVDDVSSYCKERGNAVDPQRFLDFYEAKGWMIGKNKMKDWKAAVRTWERREPHKQQKENKISYEMDLSKYD